MATITDNFQSYTIGPISGQGNWLGANASSDAYAYIVNISGDYRLGCAGGGIYPVYRSDNLGDNQYSQCLIETDGWGYLGVVVRASGYGSTFCGFVVFGNSG